MKHGRGLQSDPRRDHRLSDRRAPISKASDAQRDKVAGLPCVGCGRLPTDTSPNDPMHLAARGFRGGCNDPDCVAPGCRWCHRDADKDVGGRKVDLLPRLVSGGYVAEMQHALGHYNGDLVALLERLTGDRVVFQSQVERRFTQKGGETE